MSLLVASMVSVTLSAGQPKLVVGIVIDGLQQEYLDLLRDQFGADGLNRLMRDGVVLENIDYGTNLDATASTAVLMTGSSPATNGINASTVYDRTAQRLVDIYDDPTTLGNFTDRTFSPKNLRVTTLGDETVIAGAGVTYAYSIAADAPLAITMAGHAASGAIWMDDRTGNWASSAYYRDMPQTAVNRNRLAPLSARIDTMQWVPATLKKKETLLPEHLTAYPFRHTFKGMPNRIDAFKNSPLANREITSLASEMIINLNLGRHDGPDMLNLGLSLRPYAYTKKAENRYETIDSYLKLDRDVAALLKVVDDRVGSGNSLIYIAGTAPSSTRRRDDANWRVPSGEFSTRKAISLLNIYLISVFGNGDWVTGYHDNQFYLNTALIERNNLDIRRVRRETAYLLNRMSGVERANTIDDIIDCSVPCENPQAMMRNTVVNTAGDVHVQLIPGWTMVDDQNNRSAKGDNVTVHALTTAPAIIVSPNLEPKRIATRLDARVLAPTIAGQMYIRPPNGSAQPPLRP